MRPSLRRHKSAMTVPAGTHREWALSSLESASSTQQEPEGKFGDLDFAARKIASNGFSERTPENQSAGEPFFRRPIARDHCEGGRY